MATRTRRFVLSLVVLCAPVAYADLPRGNDEQGWAEVRVPGGVAAIARALDLTPPPDPERFLPELARRLYAVPQGKHRDTDQRLRRLAQMLDGDGPPRSAGVNEIIPLPLPPRVWSQAIFRRSIAEDRLFAAIAGDRRAALLAYGLSALDEDTLQQLARSPDMLSRLYDRHAGVFAAFGRSLRLRDGRIDVPGGDAARPLWEALVGESVTAPGRFVDALLDRDDGRLAYLYDAIAALDAPRQRFALGLWMTEGARVDYVKALYAVITSAFRTEWKPGDRPFTRVAADPAWLLLEVSVGPSGLPRGLRWTYLWERAFDSMDVPGDSARALELLDGRGVIDAALLIELVNRPLRMERAARLATYAFGQRVFADAGPAEVRDVVTALRAHQRFPMLMATLERLGVRTPALYAAAAQRAARLSDLDPKRAAVALREVQGALALIARVRAVRVVDQPTADRLVRSLVDLPLTGGRYDGGVARWLRESFLPAVAPDADGTSRSLEEGLLAALAGIGPAAPAGRPRPVTWEGRTYHVDVAAADLQRLDRIRERQGGVTLDEALAVARVGARLAAGVGPVAAVAKELGELAVHLRAIGPRVLPRSDGWPDAVAIVHRTMQALSEGPLPRNSDGSVPGARPLVELGEALVADVLASFAYAMAFRDPDDRFVLGSNVAHRHDFGLGLPGDEARQRTAWRLAEPQVLPGQPWHVTGSLLGLDVGLATAGLRRLGFDGALRAPVLNSNDRRTFAESVALMNVLDLTDADRDAIAAAIGAGRARVARAGVDPDALEALAVEAGLDGWRRQQVAWVARRQPDRVASMFAVSELLILGRPAPTVSLDAWGSSSLAANGCLCTRLLAAPDWPSVVGRADTGLLGARTPDLTLRAVELMAELGLPAALTRDVLAIATQEFVDRVQPSDAHDWVTLVRAAAALTREQIEDYTAALTSDGPLIPDSSRETRVKRP